MTGEATWRLGVGDAITRWELTPIIEASFPGDSRPMPDRMDYRFANGFTDVGELPCREAFRNSMVGRQIGASGTEFDQIYLAGDSDAVDFSGFWHEPTHVSRFARCGLYAAQAGPRSFRVSTCGGVRIWVNGREAASFEPFDRNRVNRQTVELILDEGLNDITVHFEDLCERDTIWLFELRLMDEGELGLSLSVPVDPGTLLAIERCLGSLHLDKPYYLDEPVHLVVDEAPAAPMSLDVEFGGMHRSDEGAFKTTLTVAQDSTRLPLCESREAGEGCRAITLTITHEGIAISRMIGGTFVAETRRGVEGSLADRKEEALIYLARKGRADPARTLANLHLKHDLPEAERLLSIALDRIRRREDCSDFAMVPLLWAWQHHAGTGLSEAFWQEARQEILAWRYWLDEPGNDVMWFWSENHVLCFHVSQYLAGQNFPDEIFSCSGRTGVEQKQLALGRLQRWFESMEAHGLAEWNSSAYYPIDFIGLFALLELAENEELRVRSKRLIDLIFVTMALHTHDGILGGTMGRSYEKELLAGPAAELSGFAYVGWGGGWIAQACASLPMFCLSDYVPPAITDGLIRPAKDRPLEASYTQGVDHAGRLRLWKSHASQLSTIVDHQSGQPGHQQHVVDVLLTGNPFARFWVNHPGDSRPWGYHRPSYWAGNGRLPRVAQHGPVALLMFQAPDRDELPWTHLFAPRRACDALDQEGNWLFVRSGEGFAGFCATEGLEIADHGQFAGDEWRSHGRKTAWVVAVGSGDEAAFKTFKEGWLAADIRFDKEAVCLTAQVPNGPALRLEFETPLSVDGTPVPFSPMDPRPHVLVGDNPLRTWTELKAS